MCMVQNVSVLENHHWRSLIGAMLESRAFEHLSPDIWSAQLLFIYTFKWREPKKLSPSKSAVIQAAFKACNFQQCC